MSAPGPATRLRARLASGKMIRSVGIHDAFSALLLEQAGLEMAFLGGFAASASLLGLPDLNFLNQSEMATAVARITARLHTPLVADGDTGHGDLPQVTRTVELFEAAGAAGILLEDQVLPKRCGHFPDKRVIPAAEMVLKLRAARLARRDPDFVLIARTDCRASEGIDAAIDRANRYGDEGADVVFVEAPETVPELEAMAARVRYPQLVNLVTGGKTPLLDLPALEALGFEIAVYAVDTLLVCGAVLRRLFAQVRDGERVAMAPGEMLSFDELKQILGLPRWLALRETLERD